MLHYKRADGVDLTADLYLPPNYKKSDGPLPTLMEAYPVEFKDKSNAGQVSGSPYTFTRLSWASPVFWVTQGYAVLANASIPIVGEGTQGAQRHLHRAAGEQRQSRHRRRRRAWAWSTPTAWA